MSRFSLTIQGETRTFTASRQGSRLRIDDGRRTAILHLLSAQNGQFLLEWEQPDGSRQRLRLAGDKAGENRALWVNGRLLQATRPRQGGGTEQGQETVAATIPAVVTELLVQPGDTVSAGQKCILLESMKMVIPIQAPHDGTVAAIFCQVGDSVQAGVPLLDIQPASPE